MNKTSTQSGQPMATPAKSTAGCRVGAPKKETITLLRQFARAYFPANVPTAIVLN